MFVVNYTARSVLVRWQPGFNGNAPILGYNIYQNDLDRDAMGEYVPVATSSGVGVYTTTDIMYNISIGILPFTKYVFVVEACNFLGCSDRNASPLSPPIRTNPDGEQKIYFQFVFFLSTELT